MEYAISSLSHVPLRAQPSDKSEIISQILFGETFRITLTKGSWVKVKLTSDNYEGWIDNKQYEKLSERVFEEVNNAPPYIALDLVQSVISHDQHIPIVIGSSLPFYDGMNLKIKKNKYIYNGQVLNPQEVQDRAKLLPKIALKYLNAPYLWGGRSPFGIDCSGLVQIVFKILGIPVKRDAYQQAEAGTLVNMIAEAREGDLAFFDNKEGRITHVGIILSDNRILHASGKVRMDKIDQLGIYNRELKKYTHNLRMIKRIF